MSYLFTAFEVELATVVSCNASSRDKSHNACVFATDGSFTSVWFSRRSPVSKAIRFNKIATKDFSVVIGSLLGLFSGKKSLPKSDLRNPPKSAIVTCM